jgi:hypothetical protein
LLLLSVEKIISLLQPGFDLYRIDLFRNIPPQKIPQTHPELILINWLNRGVIANASEDPHLSRKMETQKSLTKSEIFNLLSERQPSHKKSFSDKATSPTHQTNPITFKMFKEPAQPRRKSDYTSLMTIVENSEESNKARKAAQKTGEPIGLQKKHKGSLMDTIKLSEKKPKTFNISYQDVILFIYKRFFILMK